MANFTPWSSLSGGLLIGLAVALLWLGNGRVAGISGIVGNLASAGARDVRLRFASWLASPYRGAMVLDAGMAQAPVIRLDATVPVVIAGASAGRPRHASRRRLHQRSRGLWPGALLRRSIVATCLFMAAGFLTVLVMRHIAGT